MHRPDRKKHVPIDSGNHLSGPFALLFGIFWCFATTFIKILSEVIIERQIWGFTPRHAPIRHMLSSNKSRWNQDVDLKDTSSLFDRQDNMFLTSSQAEKTENCQDGSRGAAKKQAELLDSLFTNQTVSSTGL